MQRTTLGVILSLNLIVAVDKMGTIERVDKLTFGINDDSVCKKLWIRYNMIGCYAIQNPWFRKSK